MIRRGFTLLEVAIALAIVAIVTAVAFASFQATRRNTSLDGTALELSAQVQGLRFKALAEQRDHLLVIASPPGNDGSGCGILTPGDCIRVFVLRDPQPAWTLAGFDPEDPGEDAEYLDVVSLPRGTILDLGAAGTPAATPFDSATAFPADLTAACAGTRRCVAVRFASDGDVEPVWAGAPGGARAGIVLAFTTDLVAESAAAQRRGVLVSFPTGISRSFPY